MNKYIKKTMYASFTVFGLLTGVYLMADDAAWDPVPKEESHDDAAFMTKVPSSSPWRASGRFRNNFPLKDYRVTLPDGYVQNRYWQIGCYHPNGDDIFLVDEGGTCIVRFNLNTMSEVWKKEFTSEKDSSPSLVMSPKGDFLAVFPKQLRATSGMLPTVMYILNPDTGNIMKDIRAFNDKTPAMSKVIINDKGVIIGFAGENFRVFRFDRQKGNFQFLMDLSERDCGDPIPSFMLQEAGSRLFLCSSTCMGTIAYYDISGAKAIPKGKVKLFQGDSVTDFFYTGKGSTAFARLGQREIIELKNLDPLNFMKKKPVYRVLTVLNDDMKSMSVSPCGRFLIQNSPLFIWATATGKLLLGTSQFDNNIYNLPFTTGNTTLINPKKREILDWHNTSSLQFFYESGSGPTNGEPASYANFRKNIPNW